MTNEECKALYGGLEEAIDRLHKIGDLANGAVTQDDIREIYRTAYAGDLSAVIDATNKAEWRATAKPELPGHDWSESPDGETTQASTAPDAWPKDDDMYWTWTRGVRDCQPMTFPWYRTGYDRERFAAGEVFRTRNEAVAEWTRRYGKKAPDDKPDTTTTVTQWLGDTPPEPELNDAEKQLIVDAYRASIKASETKAKEPWIDVTKCPTGVPENGEWMPKFGEMYWTATAPRPHRQVWDNDIIDRQHLEDGEVCRTRAIARAVNRRKKAEVAK